MSYKYDHRLLADEMEIFFFDDQIGPGLPVWLPNGVAIRDELESFMKRLEGQLGYQRVVSPHLAKEELYEQSGHLRAFHKNMYPPIKWPEENCEYYLKPMNCPHHHKVFSCVPRSYRQLPLRIAEYGQVYRYENSGSLKGLSRVRGLCQNDAHIYIDPIHAKDEISKVLDLHEHCYSILGLKGYRYRLSLHDPHRKIEFDGPSQLWIQCEEILRECLVEKDLSFFESVGEAAFYGPKIDVQMKISAEEEESIASIQLDFNSGEKFGLSYVASSGQNVNPWVIHRAPLGSHERFVALLLEYFDGQLPGWLCPVQIYLLPLSESQQPYAKKLAAMLVERGIRSVVDENGGSLSKRILFAHKLRPFAKVIIGPKEVESGELMLELRNEKISVKSVDLFFRLKNLIGKPE